MKQLLLLLCLVLTQAQADTLTDPTKPSPNKSIFSTGNYPKAVMTEALTLTAVINNNQTKQAIINGRSFAEGQKNTLCQ
jgi:MSHA biogenesis protein MshK